MKRLLYVPGNVEKWINDLKKSRLFMRRIFTEETIAELKGQDHLTMSDHHQSNCKLLYRGLNSSVYLIKNYGLSKGGTDNLCDVNSCHNLRETEDGLELQSHPNNDIVLKIIAKNRCLENYYYRYSHELNLLKTIEHRHIAPLMTFTEKDDEMWLFFEHAQHGDLQRHTARQSLSETHARRIIFQLLLALQYLHVNGIIHHDVKPDNVLLFKLNDDNLEPNKDCDCMSAPPRTDHIASLKSSGEQHSSSDQKHAIMESEKNNLRLCSKLLGNKVSQSTISVKKQNEDSDHQEKSKTPRSDNSDSTHTSDETSIDWDNVVVKLCDFGLARRYQNGNDFNRCDEVLGSHNYMAPEILTCSLFNEKVDVWSVGVIMFQLLVAYEPFYPASKAQTEDVMFDPIYWSNISCEAKDLLAQLLNRNSALRPAASDAIEHQWFKSV